MWSRFYGQVWLVTNGDIEALADARRALKNNEMFILVVWIVIQFQKGFKPLLDPKNLNCEIFMISLLLHYNLFLFPEKIIFIRESMISYHNFLIIIFFNTCISFKISDLQSPVTNIFVSCFDFFFNFFKRYGVGKHYFEIGMYVRRMCFRVLILRVSFLLILCNILMKVWRKA